MEGKPMKKLIALFLSAVLCAGLLAGCTLQASTCSCLNPPVIHLAI